MAKFGKECGVKFSLDTPTIFPLKCIRLIPALSNQLPVNQLLGFGLILHVPSNFFATLSLKFKFGFYQLGDYQVSSSE